MQVLMGVEMARRETVVDDPLHLCLELAADVGLVHLAEGRPGEEVSVGQRKVSCPVDQRRDLGAR